MKIAINVRSFSNKGGIGRYSRALVKNLIARYPDDSFQLLSTPDTDTSFITPSGNWTFIPVAGSSNRVLWERYSLARAVNKVEPDIFHCPDYTMPPGIRYPGVVTVHDLSFKYFPRGVSLKARMLYNYLTPPSVKKAWLVMADSNFTKREIIRARWKSHDSIRVVHLAVDDTYFDTPSDDELKTVMDTYEIDPDYILYLGALDRRKNVTILVQAYSEMRNRIKNLPTLVLAGEDIGGGAEITSLVLQLGIGDCVKRIGFIKSEHLRAIYRCARFFVFPTLYEGFGLPPLEAMACGIPVIVSNRASLPEVVGDSGIAVSVDDVVGLMESMQVLLTDDDVHHKLSVKGYERARQFTWGKVADDVMNVYREVLH
ncbi:glycosyltransferase family 4 protein [bacterium]|nr:glycosyltransferase family 4 protein [bacterium]